MFSLSRVIPECSKVRLPADNPGRDSPSASSPVPGSTALQAIRSSRSCMRNSVRRRTRPVLIAALMRPGMHVAIDAVCVLRLSNFPMPLAGEA